MQILLECSTFAQGRNSKSVMLWVQLDWLSRGERWFSYKGGQQLQITASAQHMEHSDPFVPLPAVQ